jgi:hypothetical protein
MRGRNDKSRVWHRHLAGERMAHRVEADCHSLSGFVIRNMKQVTLQ